DDALAGASSRALARSRSDLVMPKRQQSPDLRRMLMRKLTFVMALSLSFIAAGSARSVLVGLTSPSPQGNNAYKTYSNTTFTYSMLYHASLLILQGKHAIT